MGLCIGTGPGLAIKRLSNCAELNLYLFLGDASDHGISRVPDIRIHKNNFAQVLIRHFEPQYYVTQN
jgi:hypothetical protein